MSTGGAIWTGQKQSHSKLGVDVIIGYLSTGGVVARGEKAMISRRIRQMTAREFDGLLFIAAYLMLDAQKLNRKIFVSSILRQGRTHRIPLIARYISHIRPEMSLRYAIAMMVELERNGFLSESDTEDRFNAHLEFLIENGTFPYSDIKIQRLVNDNPDLAKGIARMVRERGTANVTDDLVMQMRNGASSVFSGVL